MTAKAWALDSQGIIRVLPHPLSESLTGQDIAPDCRPPFGRAWCMQA